MEWTFGLTTITWLRNTDGTLPTWKRKARINERMLIGTGVTEINRHGYEPYRITGTIWCSRVAYGQLLGYVGTLQSANDGVNQFFVVLDMDVDSMAPTDAEGYTGTITLTRPTP